MKSLFSLVLALAACAAGAQSVDLPAGPAVRNCDSPYCLYQPWEAAKLLPTAVQTVTAVVTPITPERVAVPGQKAGQPTYIRVCGPYGCQLVQEPVAIVTVPTAPAPPAVYWYQPAPVNVPTVITWGPWQGNGPWGLPSGPRLQRHK